MRSAQSSLRTDSLKLWYLGRIRLSLLPLSNRALTCIPSISTVPDDFERDVGVPTGTVASVGDQAVPENLHLLTTLLLASLLTRWANYMTSWTLRTWVLIISTAEASRGFRRLLQLAYWDLAGPALPRGQGWDGMMLSPMVKELYTVQIWELRRWSSNLSNNLWWIKWDCKSVITASHVLSSRYFVQLWRFGNYSPCWEFPKRELGADSSSVQMRLPGTVCQEYDG